MAPPVWSILSEMEIYHQLAAPLVSIINRMPGRRTLSKRARLIVGVCGLALLLAFVLTSRPRISRTAIQLFAGTSCCGEYHSEVTGFILLNPLRNRTPEDLATNFLNDLKEGKCAETVPASVCRQGLVFSRPVLDWKLKNRRDYDDKVLLLYVIKGKYRTGVDVYPQDAWGEGVVELARTQDRWNIYGYGAYY